MLIAMRFAGVTRQCRASGTISGRIHSRYSRRLTDLPIAGHGVRLVLLARRFQLRRGPMRATHLHRAVRRGRPAPWARRTTRLDHIVHHLALALGGRPATSFAGRLMLPSQQHSHTPRAQARRSPLRGPVSTRDRRLRMATLPSLRDDHLRSRASQDDRAAPGPRTSDGTSLALRPATDRRRGARSRRRLLSPMMLTFSVDASPVVVVLKTTTLAHRCRRRGIHPIGLEKLRAD